MLELERGWANFIIGTGVPLTFEQYLNLSRRQKNTVISEANKARR